jgi:hypothetical protein
MSLFKFQGIFGSEQQRTLGCGQGKFNSLLFAWEKSWGLFSQQLNGSLTEARLELR